jgi:hypothetical protein
MSSSSKKDKRLTEAQGGTANVAGKEYYQEEAERKYNDSIVEPKYVVKKATFRVIGYVKE